MGDRWTRLIELGTTEPKAKSMGDLLSLLHVLEIASSKYDSVYVQKGLFGWEVGLKGWRENTIRKNK